MELLFGDCCVHDRFNTQMVKEMAAQYPDADILIHPESSCSGDAEILNMPNAYFYSTSGMVKHAAMSDKKQFIIATEKEIIHHMQKTVPGKEFIPINSRAICGHMKKATLEKVLKALESESPEIKVPDEIREKAWIPIRRMLEL
ncbi:Quinolinate synthase A [bioreactor metagenome]|uniref:quinolinate synthase n=1 Tax=bioreactor metagenome TaxID=1076179 RepID=A0A645HIZ6_9ZZZZ